MRKGLVHMIQCRFRRTTLLPLLFAAALAVPAYAQDVRVDNGEIIRHQVTQNWLAPVDLAGADKVRVKIWIKLDRSGEIVGKPKMTVTGGPEKTRKAIATGAYRAVLRSAPFKNLPFDKYDAWKEVILNFDTSDLAH